MSHGGIQPRCHLPLPLPLPLSSASTGRRSSSAATSPSLHAGSRRSPEVTSLATDEPNDGVENEDGREFGDFEEKAFFVLTKTTRPRNWCITVVLWPYPLLRHNYLKPRNSQFYSIVFRKKCLRPIDRRCNRCRVMHVLTQI